MQPHRVLEMRASVDDGFFVSLLNLIYVLNEYFSKIACS